MSLDEKLTIAFVHQAGLIKFFFIVCLLEYKCSITIAEEEIVRNSLFVWS